MDMFVIKGHTADEELGGLYESDTLLGVVYEVLDSWLDADPRESGYTIWQGGKLFATLVAHDETPEVAMLTTTHDGEVACYHVVYRYDRGEYTHTDIYPV